MASAPQPITVQDMLPTFVTGLLESPYLHLIRSGKIDLPYGDLGHFELLDELDGSEMNILGRIRSIRHASEELLHARLLLSYAQAEDLPMAEGVLEAIFSDTAHHYTLDGVHRIRRYKRLTTPAWQDFTYYRGVTVPLEVIDQMLKVEGMEDKNWTDRGMEVGPESWKVLVDWKAGLEEGLCDE